MSPRELKALIKKEIERHLKKLQKQVDKLTPPKKIRRPRTKKPVD